MDNTTKTTDLSAGVEDEGCPSCGKLISFRVSLRLVGSEVGCPHCGTKYIIDYESFFDGGPLRFWLEKAPSSSTLVASQAEEETKDEN